jgi:ABC-2 type transport system permease protein
MNLRFAWQLFSMELRRAFAYRADFWLSFIVSTGAQFIVAWFLWKSIFEHTGAGQIGGYTFPSLMLYYLVVPVIGRTVFGGNLGDIAGEIYQGSLTRYLVYPVSFFRYKLIEHCANATILMAQLMLLIIVVELLFPDLAARYAISPFSIALGIITMTAAAILYFVFTAWVQLIAFWADQVWSLVAIMRFITNLLGGSLIPLSMFPDSMRPVLGLLPFPCLIDLPARSLLGTITPREWASGMMVIGIWILVFGALYMAIWYRGNRQYSGVGI